jgi:hypothetical protein
MQLPFKGLEQRIMPGVRCTNLLQKRESICTYIVFSDPPSVLSSVSGFENRQQQPLTNLHPMQTDDLFAFLDEDASRPSQSEIFVGDVEMDEDESLPPKMRKKKRKAAEAAMAAEALETGRTSSPSPATVAQIRDLDQEETEPALKKPRLASPKPVVVDEFQTEAKREVAASAGLTGTVEAGQRLELRHQVRVLYFGAG